MLKFIALLIDLCVVVVLIFGLFVALYFIGLTTELPLPIVYNQVMEHLLAPFNTWIVGVYGPHVASIKGSRVDMSSGILLAHIAIFFVVGISVSTFLHRVDYKISLLTRAASHRMFMKKNQAEEAKIVRTSLGNVHVPENFAVVAIAMENLQQYPGLADTMYKQFERVSPSQRLFDSPRYMLVRFDSTFSAYRFVETLVDAFRRDCSGLRISFEFKPAYRIVIHSIPGGDTLQQEETFIRALLNCVGDDQIYISADTKEQLDIQTQDHPVSETFETLHLGTFSKLGSRALPDIYRLTLKNAAPEPFG